MENTAENLTVTVHINTVDGVDYLNVKGEGMFEYLRVWNSQMLKAKEEEREEIIALLEAGGDVNQIKLRGLEASNDGAQEM